MVYVKGGAGNTLPLTFTRPSRSRLGLTARANARPRNSLGNALVVGCLVSVKLCCVICLDLAGNAVLWQIPIVEGILALIMW